MQVHGQEVGALCQQLQTLQSQQQQAQAAAQAQQAQGKERQHQVHRLQGELDAARQELATLRQAAAGSAQDRSELQHVHSQLAEANAERDNLQVRDYAGIWEDSSCRRIHGHCRMAIGRVGAAVC